MGRRKKIEEIITKENTKENKISNGLFSIIALTDVKLYKTTSMDSVQGRLKKGHAANVIKEIKYTPIKMYQLDIGYYIIADHNIQKI
jgi:hypothetical protein